MPASFLKELAMNKTELWHPKLSIFPIEIHSKINEKADFSRSFLQMQIKSNEISENLRNSITLEKNSQSGQLILSSSKLNCACKFVKNYDNNSIDTAKALSTLPNFKQIEEIRDFNETKQKKILEKLEKKPEEKPEKKDEIHVFEKKSLKKTSKKNQVSQKKTMKNNVIFPDFHEKIRDSPSFLQYPPDFANSLQPPLVPQENLPRYEDLLRFYWRKKEEAMRSQYFPNINSYYPPPQTYEFNKNPLFYNFN